MASKHGQRLSQTPEHYSPERLVTIIRKILGGSVDFDPASNKYANQVIQAQKYYSLLDRGENSLELDWPKTGTMVENSPGEKTGKLVKSFWEKTVESTTDTDLRAVWIGFSLNQLSTLQKTNALFNRSPLSYASCILSNRLCFDTLARKDSDISLWAEADILADKIGLKKKDKQNYIESKVNEWYSTEELKRISGEQPTQNNYLTFLNFTYEQLMDAYAILTEANLGILVNFS
jgi:hypothetical protein